jgi:hypothetical protein
VLPTEPYLEQLRLWPKEGRHILAHYDDNSIIAYQAYRPAIGGFAAKHGKFGNMSTTLSDCHDGFRKRLAECFDEMAQEFRPHLEAAARQGRVTRRANTSELARYVVTVIEGAIMQARTLGDAKLLPRQLAYLKEHLKKCLEL